MSRPACESLPCSTPHSPSKRNSRRNWALLLAGMALAGAASALSAQNPAKQLPPAAKALVEKLKEQKRAEKQADGANSGKSSPGNPSAAKTPAGKAAPGKQAAPSAAMQERLRQRAAANAAAAAAPPTEAQLRTIAAAARTDQKKKDKDSGPLPIIAAQKPEAAAEKLNLFIRDEVFKPSNEAVPLSLVDDETFLRRAYLDVIGRAPTPNEITAFALDATKDKRGQTIDRLLSQSGYGENWSRYWRDVVMFRKADDRAMLAAQPLAEYLAAEFNKNTPWDKIAAEFLTAIGPISENGDTAIHMAQMGDTEDITSEMSRIFMSVQIQCAQCHDHPTDRWKREQFHELAAFFPRNAVRPGMAGAPQSFELVSVEREARMRMNDNGRPRGSLEHYMPDLHDPAAKGSMMQPVFFVNGKQLPSGLSDLERRGVLAMWFTSRDNPWFAKSFVNRMWSELTGEGFIEPVDDIGPDRAVTAPKALEYLAAQFVANRYDVKWLFSAIMRTESYQRLSRSRRNSEQTPFLANVAQRLRGDQLYTQLITVLGVSDATLSTGAMGRGPYARDPRFQFNFLFGYDPSVPRDDVTGSIPQALALMNGQANRALDGDRRGAVLTKILAENKTDELALVELYLRALSREPKADELATCLEHVNTVGNRGEAFEDIFWALINSAEFSHRK